MNQQSRLPDFLRLLLSLCLCLQISGCAGRYFRAAPVQPETFPQYRLEDLPYHGYWTGIVFNGNKIGFTHLELSPAAGDRHKYKIQADACLAFRFLMLDKTVNLHADDLVTDQLLLDRFEYNYDLDGNILHLSGRVSTTGLEVDIVAGGALNHKVYDFEGDLYPASVIALYPVVKGLEIGRRYQYQVFDGETQSIETVEQEVLAYEESDLFAGQAYKVRTRLHGQKAFTWFNGSGEPVLELSLGGVFISHLEDEQQAKRYLAEAALNKAENLLNFSLIKIARPIPAPRDVTRMEVRLTGIAEDFVLPSDSRQECVIEEKERICRISSFYDPADTEEAGMATLDQKNYLRASYIVPADNFEIVQTAREIVAGADTPLLQSRILVQWLQEHIGQVPQDIFSALDVLRSRKAECQGFSYLYAAFARALQIPTRVVNGIVYSPEYQGFLYHTWTESYLEGYWLPVDPTFGQIPADATHLKLVEGERLENLAPLINLIGKLQVEVLEVEASHPRSK